MLKTFCMPSVVGVGSIVSKDFGLGNLARQKSAEYPHQIILDGAEYLVGAGVERYTTPIERMDLNRFSDSAELRALLYASLYQIMGGNGKAALNVGLPVEIVMDKALLAEVARGMERWMVGVHRFTLDGVEARIEITTVRAKYSQPAGALFDYIYGDDLQVRNRLNGSWVLIVDEGFNTLDLVATGDQQQKVSGGARKGMRRASEILVASMARKYRVDDLSLAEADAMVRTMIEGKRVRMSVQGKLTDVSTDVRQAFDALAAEVVRFVESKVGDGGRFDILLTGGGALALHERLVRRWPHARLAGNDPVMSNAVGFCKIAMTRDKLSVDASTHIVGVDPGFGAIKLAMYD